MTAEVFGRFAVYNTPRLSLPWGDEYEDSHPRIVLLQGPKSPQSEVRNSLVVPARAARNDQRQKALVLDQASGTGIDSYS